MQILFCRFYLIVFLYPLLQRHINIIFSIFIRNKIREAKAKGVRFGRPRLAIPEGFPDVLQLWLDEQISLREASRRMNTNHNTFSRWAKTYLYEDNSNQVR